MAATPLTADQLAALVAEVAARKGQNRPGTPLEERLADIDETVRLTLDAYGPPIAPVRPRRRFEVSLWQVIVVAAVLRGCIYGPGQAMEFLGGAAAALAVVWTCFYLLFGL